MQRPHQLTPDPDVHVPLHLERRHAVNPRRNNFFTTGENVIPEDFIQRFNGTVIHVAGSFVNGKATKGQVDGLAEYNAVHSPDLSPLVTWTPTLVTEVHPTQAVGGLVLGNAGPFKEDWLPVRRPFH